MSASIEKMSKCFKLTKIHVFTAYFCSVSTCSRHHLLENVSRSNSMFNSNRPSVCRSKSASINITSQCHQRPFPSESETEAASESQSGTGLRPTTRLTFLGRPESQDACLAKVPKDCFKSEKYLYYESWPGMAKTFLECFHNIRRTDDVWLSNNHQTHRQGDSSGTRSERHLLAVTMAAFFGLFKKTEDEQEQEDQLIVILKRAKLEEQRDNYELANQYYHQALTVLKDRETDKTWDAEKVLESKVYIYDSMANLAFVAHKFPEAEKLYKETLKGLLQKGVPRDDNAVVEISLKLAMVCAILKRHEEADIGYKFCMETQQKKVLVESDEEVDDDTLALLGLCIDSYSRFLIARNQYKEAQEHLQKALEIARKVFEPDHQQIGVLLNDIASVASLRKNYDQAKKAVLEAIQIGEKTDSPDLPTFFCNLGAICMHMGELRDATANCSKALKLAKKCQDDSVMKQAKGCLNSIKRLKQTGKVQ